MKPYRSGVRSALRPYLTAAFAASFRKRLLENAGIALVPTAVAILISAIIFIPKSQDAWPTQNLLAQTWKAVRADMIATNHPAFPSAARVARDIQVANPLMRVKVGDGYHYLKNHHPKNGAVYVKQVTPTHLELVGRHQHDAVVELDGSLVADPTYQTRYHGHVDLPSFESWSILALIGFELLGFFATFIEDRKDRRLRLGKVVASRAALKRWQELVPDARFGPAQPQDRFLVWRPIKRDDDGVFDIYAESVMWRDEDWTKVAGMTPRELHAVQMPLETGLAEATSKWFDFCQATATHNAASYQTRLDAEELNRRRELELAAVADSARALEGSKTIAEHLPDAAELLRTLPLAD
jgi:hypothetical protein